MKRKSPRPVAPVAVDPNAPVFEIGDSILVLRPNLWKDYSGVVDLIVEPGKYRVLLDRDDICVQCSPFHADIPAAELKKL